MPLNANSTLTIYHRCLLETMKETIQKSVKITTHWTALGGEMLLYEYVAYVVDYILYYQTK